MGFSENVYRIMKEKKMSQSAVARDAGIDPKLFNSILRRRKLLREDVIIPICQSLGVTPNDVFLDEENRR